MPAPAGPPASRLQVGWVGVVGCSLTEPSHFFEEMAMPMGVLPHALQAAVADGGRPALELGGEQVPSAGLQGRGADTAAGTAKGGHPG